MPTRSLFPTRLYEADLGDQPLLAELDHSIRTLARDDEAGRSWSRAHRYAGYTSYASLNDLPKRDPAFADLAKLLQRHVAAFARELGWDVKPKLDSLWANLLKSGGRRVDTSTRTARFRARSTSRCPRIPVRSASRIRGCR